MMVADSKVMGSRGATLTVPPEDLTQAISGQKTSLPTATPAVTQSNPMRSVEYKCVHLRPRQRQNLRPIISVSTAHLSRGVRDFNWT